MQPMRPGYRLATSVIAVLLAVGLAPPAEAQGAAATTLTMTGARQYADRVTTLRIDLNDDAGPVMAQVVVERRVSGAWTFFGTAMTNPAGHAALDAELSRRATDNVFRATSTAGPSRTGPVQVALRKRNSRVTVGGPKSVVDEKTVPIRVRWLAGNGTAVPGTVLVHRRSAGGKWRLAARLRTGNDGRAQVTVKPRSDTRWRAIGKGRDWVKGDRSRVHAVDNLPPGVPVRLPRNAPRPRINLPDQPYAVGQGPNAAITRIPNGVWNQMTGRTWHRGCPVGRAGLRYVRINYWDYRGYRRRGELVAAAGAADNMAGALAEMYRKKLPIRAMYRVDRFGWSRRLHGGDDYASMAAGNTSAFNCRQVVGSPGRRSPHSYGRSLDVNTWENPYRSAQGTVPNTWWMRHSHARVAWRSRSHRVVRVMAAHGLRWTYGNGDTQHFDVRGGQGRLVARWGDCGGFACK